MGKVSFPEIDACSTPGSADIAAKDIKKKVCALLTRCYKDHLLDLFDIGIQICTPWSDGWD